jgi:dihydroorotase
MIPILIKNSTIVNEGKTFAGDLLIKDELISEIGLPGQIEMPVGGKSIDASGLIMIPGVIDEHVHFRDPG